MQDIYDSNRRIFMKGSGLGIPEGNLTYTEINVPEKQYLEKMDTTKEPAEPVFAEYPKSEMQLMKEQLEQEQADLDYLRVLSGDEEV